jgi:GMP synthase-like glutamine amidotransferase
MTEGVAMKIGVIQTGRVREALARDFGEYPPMFEAFLKPVAPEFVFETHAVVDGAPLPAPTAADGWLLTGSRHGVYDDLPWIGPLKAWLRAARSAGLPLVGVCFGHQIMAEAFGGRAVKHPGGWRLGVDSFDVAVKPGWAVGGPDRLALHSVHQDQVVEIPEDATVWARGEGCRYAGLIYGDPTDPDAISIQPHPEFGTEFARALAGHLAADGRVSPEVGARALSTIGAPVDNAAVARWIAGYFRQAGQARQAA